MSDNSTADAQALFDEGATDTFEGSFTYRGETYPLEVEDISKRDLEVLQEYQRVALQAADGDLDEIAVENLQDFSFETDDNDRDFVVTLIDHKLVSPDIDNPSDHGTRKIRAVLVGMLEAWQQPDDVENAAGEMPVEGNR